MRVRFVHQRTGKTKKRQCGKAKWLVSPPAYWVQMAGFQQCNLDVHNKRGIKNLGLLTEALSLLPHVTAFMFANFSPFLGLSKFVSPMLRIVCLQQVSEAESGCNPGTLWSGVGGRGLRSKGLCTNNDPKFYCLRQGTSHCSDP